VIELELLRTAQWQLGWRLDNGLSAAAAACVAKYQTSEAGHIIGHTAQHYHGGVGADLTYPVHRFFLWATALDLANGGAEEHLACLGTTLPERVGFEVSVRT
jgi:3-oxocholest-4-en-26-oyl-CoA dehydrogenase beta subunit